MSSRQRKNEEKMAIPYTVHPCGDGMWRWSHDITGKESAKQYPSKAKAVKAAQAAFMQSRDIDHQIRFAGHSLSIKGGHLSVERKNIDTSKKGDYGADPIGDGTFRMVPSGDIVSFEERMKRLGRK